MDREEFKIGMCSSQATRNTADPQKSLFSAFQPGVMSGMLSVAGDKENSEW